MQIVYHHETSYVDIKGSILAKTNNSYFSIFFNFCQVRSVKCHLVIHTAIIV